MAIDIPPNHFVFCLCEGKTEEWIIHRLLDNRSLCFTREQVHEQRCLRKFYRNGHEFAKRYLTFSYDQPIDIIIIQDSKTPRFQLKKPYAEKVSNIYYGITHPEIEMLMVVALGR